MRGHALPWLAAVLLICCNSCGSRTERGVEKVATPTPVESLQEHAPPIGGLPRLPAPSELEAMSREPATHSNNVFYTTWESSFLASQLVENGVFSPDYQEGGNRNPAYGCYDLYGLPEIEGEVPLTLWWEDEEPQPENTFAAVANFATERWDWVTIDGPAVPIGIMDEIKSGNGHIYMLVLLTGSGSYELDFVVLGIPPPHLLVTNDMDPDPTKNIAPREVTFDFNGSFPLVYEIEGFEVDYDGDGIYDHYVAYNPHKSTENVSSHIFEPGTFKLRFRIIDVEDNSDYVEHTIQIIDPDNVPPTPVITTDKNNGESPLSVKFDPGLSSDDKGIIEYRWDFDNKGLDDLVNEGPEAEYWTFHEYGTTTVKLTVKDTDLAEASTTTEITLTKGWRHAVIEDAINLKGSICTFSQGTGDEARVGVTYIDADANDLVFRRSLDSLGSSWDERRLPNDAEDRWDESSDSNFFNDTDKIRVGGYYSILNAVSGNREIYFQHSTSDTGESWDPPVKVSGNDNASGVGGIFRIGEKLNIFAGQDMGITFKQNKAVVYQSSTDDGSSWNPANVIYSVQPNPSILGMQAGFWLSGVEEWPMISFITNDFPGSSMYVVPALDADGFNWGEPVFVDDYRISDMTMAILGGNPAIMTGADNSAALSFARATDAEGTDWGDGAAQVGEIEGDHPVLRVADSGPVAMYYDTEFSALCLIRAADAIASAWLDREIIAYVEQSEIKPQMAILNGEPITLHYDPQNFQLVASYNY